MYGKKLRELRKLENWTQEEVAKKIGVTKQTYSHYENENRKPSLDTIRELAAVYQVDIDDIFAENKVGEIVAVPIIGRISCGSGTFAFEEIEGYEPTPKEWLNGGDHFYLRAKGDSMVGARIFDGDLLLIRKQEEVENGSIAAVLIDEEAVLKRVYRNGRIVHYNNPFGTAAAIIINVREDGTVDLQVFFQDGHIVNVAKVNQGELIGTWNWPPRV